MENVELLRELIYKMLHLLGVPIPGLVNFLEFLLKFNISRNSTPKRIFWAPSRLCTLPAPAQTRWSCTCSRSSSTTLWGWLHVLRRWTRSGSTQGYCHGKNIFLLHFAQILVFPTLLKRSRPRLRSWKVSVKELKSEPATLMEQNHWKGKQNWRSWFAHSIR